MLLLLGLCLTLPYKQQQQTPGAVLQVNSQGHFQYASTSWFARALGLLQSSGVEGIAVDVWVSVLLVLEADAAYCCIGSRCCLLLYKTGCCACYTILHGWADVHVSLNNDMHLHALRLHLQTMRGRWPDHLA